MLRYLLKYFVQVFLSGCQVSLPLPLSTGYLPDDRPDVLQGPQAPVISSSSVPEESRPGVRITQVTAVIRNGPDRGSAGRFIILSPEQSGTLQVRRLSNVHMLEEYQLNPL